MQVKWMKKKRQWRQRCCQEHDQENNKNKERENSVVCRFQSVMCRAITQRDRKGRGGGRSSTKKGNEKAAWSAVALAQRQQRKKEKLVAFEERGKKKLHVLRLVISFAAQFFLLFFPLFLFFSFLSLLFIGRFSVLLRATKQHATKKRKANTEK